MLANVLIVLLLWLLAGFVVALAFGSFARAGRNMADDMESREYEDPNERTRR